MSIVDFKAKRLDRNRARKKIAEIVSRFPENIHFSRHSMEEMENDGLTTIDIWNVLKSDARVINEGELVNGSYRYRLETTFIMVVIAFHSNGKGLNVVTVWDKRKKP